jgi:CelD/BcsL family acetyltransferase involved in cellulose biosynthesis
VKPWLQLVDDPGALERLHQPWEDLLSRSAHSEPTQSPLWMIPWWRVFGPLDGRKPRVALFYDRDRVVGLLPLTLRTHRYLRVLPFRRLELWGSGESEADETCSDYIGFTVERGAEESVAEAFAEALTRGQLGAWDELVLPAMNGDSTLPALITGALNRAGVRAEGRQTGSAPHIALPSSFEAYTKQLPSSRRYVITRSMRDFDKWAGKDAVLHLARDNAELTRGRAVLHSLHGERWGGEGDSGVFASPRFTAFHDQVMPELLARGALELMWLEVRGEPIAAVYNIIWDNKVHFYQSGRKIEVPKGVRPGVVIHAMAIKKSIELGRREYDFLNGTSQYKMQLSTAIRPLVTVRAVGSPLLERARLLAEAAADRLRELRKSHLQTGVDVEQSAQERGDS